MTAFSQANTKHAVDGAIGVNLTATHEDPEFALGTVVKGNDGTEWVYVQASGAITQYDAVGIDEDYQAAALTKTIVDDGWEIGFAQVAFTDNYYGWVATKGKDIGCRLRNACAADVALYTSASAGMLDDTSTGQTKVDGVVAIAVSSASGQAVEIIATYPRSGTF